VSHRSLLGKGRVLAERADDGTVGIARRVVHTLVPPHGPGGIFVPGH
jgi:hypothetical protein